MKKYQLGEFEEIVLLTVGVLYDQAYGVAIKADIESRLERKVSVGALQSALRRMETKGFVESKSGEATAKRGGKPKRFFYMTSFGRAALEYNRQVRAELWNAMPDMTIEMKFS
ncbi:MAG: helix-turn-helix transcriptional regulator [Reichenbachiella sp.]|uniref:PadR family transcriptional regulator n=1 Tax=Reichenbachiella sp. TaxID=2184521 RepID=UPI0032675D9A